MRRKEKKKERKKERNCTLVCQFTNITNSIPSTLSYRLSNAPTTVNTPNFLLLRSQAGLGGKIVYLSVCLFACLPVCLAQEKEKEKKKFGRGGVDSLLFCSGLVCFALLCFTLISSGVCGWTLWAGG